MGKEYVFIQPLIKKGLKAQLQLQSFVTGQLMVNLDFYPDKPIRLVGLEKKYPEIPTIPTSLEALTKTLQDMKLEELSRKITLSVEGIESTERIDTNSYDGKVAAMSAALEKLSTDVAVAIRPIIQTGKMK